MVTNHGTVTFELYPAAAPVTVQNFIDLAEGRKEFLLGEGKPVEQRPFYDGLIFHRVIPNFMIQGGCPEGTGRSGPGFVFNDEINAKGLKLHQIKALRPDSSLHPMCAYQERDFFFQVVWPIMVSQGVGMESPKKKSIRR